MGTADGNQLAVGADFDNDKGSYSGSVYLFELPPATSTNTETLTSTLTSTTETSLTTEESSTATVTATETTTLTSSTETSLTESSTATETTTPHATTEISATDLIVESSGSDRRCCDCISGIVSCSKRCPPEASCFFPPSKYVLIVILFVPEGLQEAWPNVSSSPDADSLQ